MHPDMSDDKIPFSLRKLYRSRVLTYSPALVFVFDSQGRWVGRTPDGSVINKLTGGDCAGNQYNQGLLSRFHWTGC